MKHLLAFTFLLALSAQAQPNVQLIRAETSSPTAWMRWNTLSNPRHERTMYAHFLSPPLRYALTITYYNIGFNYLTGWYGTYVVSYYNGAGQNIANQPPVSISKAQAKAYYDEFPDGSSFRPMSPATRLTFRLTNSQYQSAKYKAFATRLGSSTEVLGDSIELQPWYQADVTYPADWFLPWEDTTWTDLNWEIQ